MRSEHSVVVRRYLTSPLTCIHPCILLSLAYCMPYKLQQVGAVDVVHKDGTFEHVQHAVEEVSVPNIAGTGEGGVSAILINTATVTAIATNTATATAQHCWPVGAAVGNCQIDCMLLLLLTTAATTAASPPNYLTIFGCLICARIATSL
jgi:hypothetical protein